MPGTEQRIIAERLDLALSAGNVAWWELDVATGRVEANEHKPRMLGYKPQDFANCHYSAYTSLIHPDDYESAMDAMRKHLYGELPLYECEYRIRHANGGWIWFYDRGAATERDAQGRPLTVKGVVLDVSERHRYQEKLENSLAEKDFLINEIHHRVKNNLNLVNILLWNLREQTTDALVRESFTVLSRRILAIASLHDLLQKSNSLDRLDLGPYLGDIVELLVNDFTSGGTMVTIKLDLNPCVIGHEKATKIGLIVNEVVTNSLKHAFTDKTGGEIYLAVRVQAWGEPFSTPGDGPGPRASTMGPELIIEVGNDGPPLDPAQWFAGKSFGHLLVEGYTKDLNGVLTISNQPGPCFTFRFPLSNLAPEEMWGHAPAMA